MSYREHVEEALDLLQGEYVHTAGDVRVYDDPTAMDLREAAVHALLAIAAAIARDHDRPTGPVGYDG